MKKTYRNSPSDLAYIQRSIEEALYPREFSGDSIYSIQEEKLVIGDEICFSYYMQTGHLYLLEAIVLEENDIESDNHTFTLKILKCNYKPVGYKILISSSALYDNNDIFRKKWKDEDDRERKYGYPHIFADVLK